MSLRHKAVMAALSKGLSSDWNDDHHFDPTEEILHDSLIPGPLITFNWNTAQTAGGSAPVWSMTGNHAWVVFNTGGVTNNISSMLHILNNAVSNMTHPDDLPVLTFSMQIVAVHDAAGVANSVIEAGFQDDSDALFTVNLHHALFRVYDGKVHAVTGDGAAETETEIADYNEFGVYRIEFTSTQVKFYVDDLTAAAATHTTNLPDADLTLKASVRSRNNVDSTIHLDALAWGRLRKQ